MPCISNGGCRGEGALNRKIANHRKRLPITRGSMLLLLLLLLLFLTKSTASCKSSVKMPMNPSLSRQLWGFVLTW